MAEKSVYRNQSSNSRRPGWATFFGSTPCLKPAEMHAQIGFLGVPLDATTNDRPGSRFGPAAVRDASMRLRPKGDRGWLDVETGRTLLPDVSLADAGDVDIRVVELEENFRRITQAVASLLQAGALPILIGGDHAITFPVVKAFASHPMWIVHFDAHLDFTDDREGVRYSHDNPLRRVRELPFVRGIVSLGVRGLLTDAAPYLEARELGVMIIPAADIHLRGVETALAGLPPLGDFYLSLDIDALNTA